MRSNEILDGFFCCPTEQNRVHPTQKPVSLLNYIIKILPGGSILDPFMGSGSTGIAALQSGREFIGIEQDENYFTMACERIRQAHNDMALLGMVKESEHQSSIA